MPPFVIVNVSFPESHDIFDDAVAAFVVPSDNSILPIDGLFIVKLLPPKIYEAVVANDELTALRT